MTYFLRQLVVAPLNCVKKTCDKRLAANVNQICTLIKKSLLVNRKGLFYLAIIVSVSF